MSDRDPSLPDARRAAPGIYQPWLHRFACVMVGATLLLICAGGHVKSNEAGLSVPDWPTTFHQNMFTFPLSKWTGGIKWEHSHRLIAATVGLLTIAFAAVLWVYERRAWVRWLGIAALVAVVLQGVLGGLTVIYQLPAPISVAHGCLAQIFFCSTIAIAVFTSKLWLESPRPAANAATPGVPLYRLGLIAVAAIFAQLILGAMMRHTESGLAVPDFPRAYGQWSPSLDPASLARYNADRAAAQLPPVTRDQIIFHLLHRAGAIVTTAIIALAGVSALSRYSRDPRLANPAVWLLSLTALQIMLGAATVMGRRPPVIATLHVAVGAMVLGFAVLLTLRAWRLLPAGRIARTDYAEPIPAVA